MTIGTRIKELRKETGYTQQEVCDLMNMKKSTYAGYEIDFRVPPLEALSKIANFYGVSESYIINGDKNNSYELPGEFAEGLLLLKRANEILDQNKKKELLRYMKYMIDTQMEENKENT